MSENSGINSLRKKDLDKFISIHVHKSGGTTFAHILKDMYRDRFFWDKSEDTEYLHGRVKNYNMAYVSKHDVIHGHVNIDKYSHLKRPYITWLRHPVSRLESEFSIIRQKRITKSISPFHRRIILEELTFLDYIKELNEVYTRYLGDRDVKDFAFIGITEMYEISLFVFSQKVGMKIPSYYKRNVRKIMRQWFKEGSPKEKKICAKKNPKDIAFYNRAKERLMNEFESCVSLYVPGECAPQYGC